VFVSFVATRNRGEEEALDAAISGATRVAAEGQKKGTSNR